MTPILELIRLRKRLYKIHRWPLLEDSRLIILNLYQNGKAKLYDLLPRMMFR